ncbi:hypothetical protein BD410DRAFT_745865 [Rickenella mellea]|uniref:chitin deacetylase n=1 Tax=Rickenella mellea TaxID=50990 RepID=A0A4Y7Q8G1_9AGAM|nr:hypothetical protein BD410DRAFT_745865 [Rickenella mellea]
MKFYYPTLAALFTLASANDLHARHAQLAHNKRQNNLAATGATTSSAPPTPPAGTSASAPAAPPQITTTPLGPGTDIPPLASIVSGAPPEATAALTATFSPGQKPTYSGALPLPSTFVFRQGDWPTSDVVPDTTTPQVQAWMQELNGFNIPNIPPTADGTCVGDPTAASDAANRGWWTCGGFTRVTDIVACPNKLTWGVSFDDGPSDYSTKLLDFLGQKSLQATFFVVGSRVIERPQVLLEEYMSGHEISVHTWSHRPLTKLTNEQVVAELGWTRKAIQAVLGVTPTTMRPPYGDIDDRVRAISMAMGMTPIIWTRSPSGQQFDTNDWRVPGGLVNGTDSLTSFQQILGNATQLDTGFVVLQHDLFQQTVDLAVGYSLPAALSFQPQLTLEPIGKCQGWPASNLYLETTTNTTFPFTNSTISSNATTTNPARASAAATGAAHGGSGGGSSSGALGSLSSGVSFLVAAALALVGGLLVV